MKVGIIGSGHIAGIHGPIVLRQPGLEVVGIADKDLVRARSLATRLNVDSAYEDAETMVSEQKPDAVHVLVPPQYHAPLSIMAMEHGCHVLVEKPLALTPDDARKMLDTAKRKGVYLFVDHSLIFEEVVQKAFALVLDGTIGALVSVEASYAYDPRRNPAVLEEGAQYTHWSYQLNGGLLQDLMPHPAALVMELLPEINEVKSIGVNRGLMPEGWQDEIKVLVNAGNILGTINISLNEKPDAMGFIFKGTAGTIQGDVFNNSLILRRQSALPRAVARGLSGFMLARQYLGGSINNAYRFARGRIDKSGGIGPAIASFYDYLQNGGEPPVPMAKAYQVVDLTHRVWPTPPAKITQESVSIPRPSAQSCSKPPTALVTGATGFIGTHLVQRLLAENIGVRVLVRPNSIHAGRLRNSNVDVVEGDLSDPKALYEATTGIKTIYHAGAATNNDWDEHSLTTIKGTEYLIDAALTNKVERLVHVSTLAVYEMDRIKKHSRVNEDSPYQRKPILMGAYAYSKLESEKLVLQAHQDHGLGVTVVRPGIVIGPFGRVLFPHLGYKYQDKFLFLLGKGDAVLPLTYVENTVDGIYQASVHDEAIGQIYNLVDDGEITARDYLERFVEVTGAESRIIHLPYFVPYFATAGYEIASSINLIKKGLTSRRQLRWKHKDVYFDNTKAKEQLNWVCQVPIEEGMLRTFQWYRDTYLVRKPSSDYRSKACVSE